MSKHYTKGTCDKLLFDYINSAIVPTTITALSHQSTSICKLICAAQKSANATHIDTAVCTSTTRSRKIVTQSNNNDE